MPARRARPPGRRRRGRPQLAAHRGLDPRRPHPDGRSSRPARPPSSARAPRAASSAGSRAPPASRCSCSRPPATTSSSSRRSGVGQNEIAVSEMVDTFLLLTLARAGDQLQGIKRGILELADVIAVNKADGDGEGPARVAARELAGAMRLMMPGPVGAPAAGAHLLGADRRRARRGVVGGARAPRAPGVRGVARGPPGAAAAGLDVGHGRRPPAGRRARRALGAGASGPRSSAPCARASSARSTAAARIQRPVRRRPHPRAGVSQPLGARSPPPRAATARRSRREPGRRRRSWPADTGDPVVVGST